jgi:hypothetical protein
MALGSEVDARGKHGAISRVHATTPSSMVSRPPCIEALADARPMHRLVHSLTSMLANADPAIYTETVSKDTPVTKFWLFFFF